MKRLLTALLLLCLACCAACAEDPEKRQAGDYTYVVLEDGTAEIVRYSGRAETLDIPAELDGVRVTSIGDSTLFNCSSLTSVTIPDSVTSIGNSTFSGCYGLTSVTIPAGVTSIGDSAFYRCSGLTSVTIPDSVTDIGANPFGYCENLSEIRVSPGHPLLAVTDGVLFRKTDKTLICYPMGKKGGAYRIPNGTAVIGVSAFYSCSGLTSVTIPDSVTSIEDYAFSWCSGLTSVTIPASVTSIGDSAFSGCDGLTSITIPASVTSIGNFAFSSCSGLTSVMIPDSVTSIGDWAFFRCSGLTSVTISDSVTSIGKSAFSGCSGLTSVTIPASVTSIGDSVFYDCPNLTLTVRKNSYAEQYCKDSELKYQYPDADYCTFADLADGTAELTRFSGAGDTLTLPAEANGLPVTQISDGALRSCTCLTSVSLPETVTISGANPFRFCENLAHLYVSPENPSLAVIDDVLFRKTDRTLICCPRGRSGASYAIPEGIARIGAFAFDDCALTAVTIPDSVTFIGEGAFRGCSDLTALTIPEGVTEIGAQAFADCPNLTLTVTRDSAAAQYCRDNGLKYEYTDALDWLHS